MDSLGLLNAMEIIDMKIRSKVGVFLGLKERLHKLKRSNILTVQSKAASYLIKQIDLEIGLDETLDIVDATKEGVWTYSDVLKITAFYWEMVEQTDKVRKLEEENTRAGGIVKEEFKISKWAWYVGGSLLAFSLLKKIR